MEINSKEYWNHRFETDWNTFGGDHQTIFFANTLCNMIPKWFVDEVITNQYTICDLGCAQGDALPIWNNVFQNANVCGEDFSENAISNARKKYPEFMYLVSDILQPEGKKQYDVVISSNTMEHFKDTKEVLKCVCRRSKKYTVLMLPYREDEQLTQEHEVIFHTDKIPYFIEDNVLIYARTCQCNSKYYPGEQILLIYAKDAKETMLSDLVEHVNSDSYKKLENEFQDVETQYHTLENESITIREKNEKLTKEKAALEIEKDDLWRKREALADEKKVLEDEKARIQSRNEILEDEKAVLEDEKAKLQNRNKELENEKTLLENEKGNIQSKTEELTKEKAVLENKTAELENEIKELKKAQQEQNRNNAGLAYELEKTRFMLEYSEKRRVDLEDRVSRAIAMCKDLTNWGLYKVSHLLHRTKHQLFNKSGSERKQYIKWISNWLKGNGTDTDYRFKPVYRIIDILQEQENRIDVDIADSQLRNHIQEEEQRLSDGNIDIEETNEIKEALNTYQYKAPIKSYEYCALGLPVVTSKKMSIILGRNYQKFDVIILGVIDYAFRFQRPQQLALRYAQNGHRVFYFNANHYNESSLHEIRKNLYVINIHNDKYTAIHLTDWTAQKQELTVQLKKVMDSYCIRDAITIVDYPNWIHAAEFLRKEYGFKIITDYMDDYTGFLNPAGKLVKQNCEQLLQVSDGVIASSQFLYDIAAKYNGSVSIVRNGTEYEHFHMAFDTTRHKRQIVGYYGAVAEWFQADKVVYLARNLPECEIIIIGEVTKGEAMLQKCSNIKLLGEKPYSELPGFLKEFDVCIIPFDTSTDLIKATNPVKFYEYLSAGKKIVSTEIPELEMYRNQYVYMANDNQKFLEYVKLCLSGMDTLRSADECADFAKQHDWQERYESFYQNVINVIPKISVIVLTYNNLEINQLCIKSILEKTAYPNYELIVVDNCSTDGTREYLSQLAQEKSYVKVILNEKNVGFAAGNNVGMKQADGKYIILLNNDTMITRGWMTALAKHMENNKTLGMCGPVTNSIGNEAKIKVDYHNVEELEEFAYHYTTKHLSEEYQDIRVLAFFCTMIRKKVVEECGYLDEAYGIGMFEDDDYVETVKSKGYSLTIAEDAFVHHFHGVSFNKLEEGQFREIFNVNKERFEKKWGKTWIAHKTRKGVGAMDNSGCMDGF